MIPGSLRQLASLRALCLLSCLLSINCLPAAEAKRNTQQQPERYYPRIEVAAMVDNVPYSPVGDGNGVSITSKAGFRVHPVTGRGDFHNGVDLGAQLNNRVYCLLDGIVTRVGWRGNLGVAVEVYHPYPNVSTIVGHLNGFAVLPGQPVRRGQVLGFAGTTGRSTGVHVHYTVITQPNHEYVEPLDFIKQVPNYVKAMRSAQAQMAYAHNMRALPKIDRKLIDTETDDLPEEKDGKKETAHNPPSASIEP